MSCNSIKYLRLYLRYVLEIDQKLKITRDTEIILWTRSLNYVNMVIFYPIIYL